MKKNFLKLLSFSFLFLFAISCGDDDGGEVAPSLDDVEFAFSTTEPPITIPSGLTSSSDPQAQQINGLLQTTNLMTVWLQFFEAPAGAEKSTTPIGGKSAINGRTQSDVVVYSWTAEGGGDTWTVAYQIGDDGSKYTFEIFFKFNDSDFERFLYAEESKDELNNGFMEVYSIDVFGEDIGDTAFFRYEWTESAVGLQTFKLVDSEDSFEIFITINPDGSGTVSAREDGQAYYEATWNASGTSGTWTLFDGEGNIVESGIWPE